MKKIYGRIISISTSLFCSLTISGCNHLIKPCTRILEAGRDRFTYTQSVTEDEVYFIRSAVDNNMVIDVPASLYNNGQRVNLYRSNGMSNQRFIFKKSIIFEGRQSYIIQPVDAQHKQLTMELRSMNPNARLELKDIDVHDSVYGDVFFIEPVLGSDTVRIMTGSSIFRYYLTTLNYQLTNDTSILQQTLDNNHLSNFEWRLEKTDTMILNHIDIANVTSTDLHFNVRVPTTGNYIFKTERYINDVDTILTLKDKQGNLITSNDDYNGTRYSYIDAYLTNTTDYQLKLRGYGSSTGEVKVMIYPEKQVFFNSFVSLNDIDTRQDMMSPRFNFENDGWVFNDRTHTTISDLNEMQPDGMTRINREYYMLTSHGLSTSVRIHGGVVLNDDENLYSENLPIMDNNILSVWATCYGGQSGNIADVSVNVKGAENSLGFPGLTKVETSREFTDILWARIIFGGETIQTAVAQALAQVKSNHPLRIWGDDTIIHPQLYTQNGLITFENNSNSNIVLENYNNLSNSVRVTSNDLHDSTRFYKADTFDNATIYIETIDGYKTNQMFVEQSDGTILTNNVFIEKEDINSNSLSSAKRFDEKYILKIGNEIKYVGWCQTVKLNENGYENLEEIYIDLETGEELSQDILDVSLRIPKEYSYEK